MKGEFVWLLPEAANDNRSSGLQGDLDDGAGGWMPLAVMTGSAASTVIRYLHGDRLGMPVATTDTTGAVTTPGTYAELQFPGQMKTLTDVYYNHWRDYDQGTGRYVQADPIGIKGGGNIYVYAEANPLRQTDPTGLSSVADSTWQLCLYNPLACGIVASLVPPPPPKQCPVDNHDRCDVEWENDRGTCRKAWKAVASNGLAVCYQTAFARYSECRTKGGPITPLFLPPRKGGRWNY